MDMDILEMLLSAAMNDDNGNITDIDSHNVGEEIFNQPDGIARLVIDVNEEGARLCIGRYANVAFKTVLQLQTVKALMDLLCHPEFLTDEGLTYIRETAMMGAFKNIEEGDE